MHAMDVVVGKHIKINLCGKSIHIITANIPVRSPISKLRDPYLLMHMCHVALVPNCDAICNIRKSIAIFEPRKLADGTDTSQFAIWPDSTLSTSHAFQAINAFYQISLL